MNSFWVGVIVGCACSTVLFTVLSFTTVEQNKVLQAQVKELTEKVEEHEKIMRCYEYYNWQFDKRFAESLKMENGK